MGIYLASPRRLFVSSAVLAVSAALFLPATAIASGRHHAPAAESTPVAATVGLLSPEAVLGDLPGKNDGVRTVLYIARQKDYYASPSQIGACASAAAPGSRDRVTVRTATTLDGVHFTDRGPVDGLGDPNDPGPDATRFVELPATLVTSLSGALVLSFSSGNCDDADGAFHTGYATSLDGLHWALAGRAARTAEPDAST